MMTAEFASITKEGIEIHPTIADLPEFPIPSDYEYDKSTEYNYKIDEDDDKRECVHREYKGDFESESAKYRGKFKDKFVGRYIEERKQMDYNYHKIYTPSRQLYQDEIISRFLETLIRDLEHNTYCDVPEYNWIVFTAGPMGVGKSFTMEWLDRHGLFPLEAFVQVDPDMLRNLLPETKFYSKESAGRSTQKEVGYMSEIMTLHALKLGKNVLVDGSLRDAVWYSQYIRTLKSLYPETKVAIIQVAAAESLVFERARKRQEETGRHVPIDLIRDSFEQVRHSVEILTPMTNLVASFLNDKEATEPRFISASQRTQTRIINPDVEAALEEDPLSTVRSNGDIIISPDEWTDYFKEVWKMTCRI